MHTRIQREYRTAEFKLACISLNKDNSEVPQFPTFFPVTHSDRPPLYLEWQSRKAAQTEHQLEEAKQQNSFATTKPPKGREWLVDKSAKRKKPTDEELRAAI